MGGVDLRKGSHSHNPNGSGIGMYIVVAAFLVCIIVVALGFLMRDRGPDLPPPPPPIDVTQPDSGDSVGPISDADDGLPQDGSDAATPVDAQSQASIEEATRAVRSYRLPSGNAGTALKRTIDKYVSNIENHCRGTVAVRTESTALNVRSGPSVKNGVVGKAARDSTQHVMLWAWDESTGAGGSTRWFLLVDEQKKSVLGWVSGEYADASAVTYLN